MADVIATHEVFASTDALREVWPTPVEVASGTALLSGTKPGVAYTNSGAHTGSKTIGPLTFGFPDGGAGLEALEVSVATDGTWEFPVTGGAGAAQGTPIYAVVASGRITSLTTTASGNTLFGHVNLPAGQTATASAVPVKIGA